MITAQRYRNGVEFPNEGFVQSALDRHFAELGFTEHCGTQADIDLRNPATGLRWVVEAKGDTKQNAGLDFKTGLGQLFLGMSDPDAMYGVAIPNVPRLRTLCARFPERVRASLNLHWFLVDADSSVTVVPPGEKLEKRACCLTRHSSGTAAPPTEFQRAIQPAAPGLRAEET